LLSLALGVVLGAVTLTAGALLGIQVYRAGAAGRPVVSSSALRRATVHVPVDEE
jgi:hypothetical protein